MAAIERGQVLGRLLRLVLLSLAARGLHLVVCLIYDEQIDCGAGHFWHVQVALLNHVVEDRKVRRKL